MVLRPSNAETFAAGAVRDVIVANFELRSSARANLEAIRVLGERLAARGYTHALVATEDPGGYRLAAATGAPVRIGFEDLRTKPFKALWSRRLLTTPIYRSARLNDRTIHECATLFALVAPLVDETAPTRDLARLRSLVLDSQPAPDERVAVQITDKWERLGIAFESVVELVRRVASAGEPHLLASQSESSYARRVEQSTGLPIRYFDTLPAWKSAIAAAPALVAPDSGAMHVAGMTGTPVVGIFPPVPHYSAWVARWAPWAAPHRIVRSDHDWPALASDALAQLL